MKRFHALRSSSLSNDDKKIFVSIDAIGHDDGIGHGSSTKR